MTHQLYAFIALDIARQRTEEAMRDRLVSTATMRRPALATQIRRALARGLAVFSRSSVSAVRRLDSCIGDDLARTLAPTK